MKGEETPVKLNNEKKGGGKVRTSRPYLEQLCGFTSSTNFIGVRAYEENQLGSRRRKVLFSYTGPPQRPGSPLGKVNGKREDTSPVTLFDREWMNDSGKALGTLSVEA